MSERSRITHAVDALRVRLGRHRGQPLSYTAVRVARYASGRMLAPWYLARCDRVGRGARVWRHPIVENAGAIEIGEDANIASPFAPVQLITKPGARLEIGRGVTINFGSRISTAARVTIGDRVSFGPYVDIADHDDDGEAAPIEIGDGVWLAARVRVSKGVRIGNGTVVCAGSVVTRSLPDGVVAGGNPAVVLSRRPGAPSPASAGAPEAATVPAPPSATPVTVARETARDVAGRGILIADFSVDELARDLRQGREGDPRFDVEIAPFGQVVQALHDLETAPRSPAIDFAVVWTRPETVSGAFGGLLAQEPVDHAALTQDVDAFVALIRGAARSVRYLFVPAWTAGPAGRGIGMSDLKIGGIGRAVLQMNARLAAAFDDDPAVFVLNTESWLAAADERWSHKLWHLAKIGFPGAVLAEAAADVRAALDGLAGRARKLVVVDLDDTLWGGIVGDVGWERLRLGGHDGLGEAFVDFQRELKALTRRGMLLAVASKNDESIAAAAIEEHPEMVLRLRDFAARRIDWRDKAANIADIARELNLGLQSVVFIDDNPVERARVRQALPDVFVPEWPTDAFEYSAALRRLRCFDTPRLTDEDRARAASYAGERKRRDDKALYQSLDEWLIALNTQVRFAPLDRTNLARATQLLNKTNQMNLRTRRLSEAEFSSWAAEPGHEVWTIDVEDVHGRSGLTGLLGLEMRGDVVAIADYVLSCRVMGRHVEQALVAAAAHRGRALGATRVVAEHLPTARNRPCLDFWKRSGFDFDEQRSTFSWSTANVYVAPRGITVSGLTLPTEESQAVLI